MEFKKFNFSVFKVNQMSSRDIDFLRIVLFMIGGFSFPPHWALICNSMLSLNMSSLMRNTMKKGWLMRTTVTLEDELFEKAQRLVNTNRPSELFSLSLQALIKQEKAKRLFALGGTMPEFKTPLRNR